jgi:hypothetical protein
MRMRRRTGANGRDRSLIARLRVVMPMLVAPEGAQFRDKYGRLLLTVLHLTARLINDFLNKPRPEKKDSPA